MVQVQSFPAANLVTGARIVLAVAVVSVAVADGSRPVLAGLLTLALLSDFADGRIARRTGTESAFGARLDLEADALLILVMSAIVSTHLGWWVLWLGLVRYVFAAVVASVPRLRTEPPARPWCKVVAVLVGTVLAVAVVGLLPDPVEVVALAVVSVLLAESFLHEAVDRWWASSPDRPGVLTRGASRA